MFVAMLIGLTDPVSTAETEAGDVTVERVVDEGDVGLEDVGSVGVEVDSSLVVVTFADVDEGSALEVVPPAVVDSSVAVSVAVVDSSSVDVALAVVLTVVFEDVVDVLVPSSSLAWTTTAALV